MASDQSSRRPLPDQAARDHVAGALKDTVFVEAGAGSGKTSALVDRIVNLVDGGVSVGRIAAITFTEAAARELRTRVRDALADRGSRGVGDVESAAFTTLHGFALRLLSDHAIEAGLPPGFGVVDEITSALDFERDWRLFVGHVGDDLELLDLQERAAALEIKTSSFASVAKSFDDNWDLLEQFDDLVSGRLPPLSELNHTPLLDRLFALEGLTASCISADDKMCAGIVNLVDSVRQLADEDPLLQIQGLKSLPWPRRNAGRKQSWRDPGIDHVRNEIEAARTEVAAGLDALRHEIIEQFKTLVAQHVLRRVQARQQAGLLSFHDLLVLARRLLRSNEPVRQTLHQRYTRLLLDEFQDTDPIQIELAVLLAHPGPVAGRSWHELAPELPSGRLVVVGDPKQAIYRFRRADIGVYGETEAVLVDEPTKLVTNFRSVPGIVDWVNQVFGQAIGSGEPGAQPPYTPLEAARLANPKIEVPVTLLGSEHDREFSIGEIREFEAADVAAIVCRIMEDDWPVEDNSPETAGEWRPARLRDIAVLIPSRLSLPALESAFAVASIPFRPETNSLVYSTQEVRDLVAAVRAVVDPGSSIDVVAALRSNVFAVNDQDLLAWKLDGQLWDYRQDWPAEVEASPVARAYRDLRSWHADRWWTEPATLIDRIIRERRLRELALAESRPRDRWRRYRFLTEQARLFSQTQNGDLQDFVDWVEIQSSDLARVTEPVPPEPDDDAVRVLTVHGAKGLEFPIAVLAGAPSLEGRRQPGPQVLFGDDGWPEVKLGKDKRTSGFDVRASVEEILDGHERVRLHYVAATRARDHLIVSAHHKAGLASIGRRTWEIVQAAPELWQSFKRLGDERYEIQPTTQLRLAGDSFDDDLERWHQDQQRVVADSAASTSWSPSLIAETLADPSPAERVDELTDVSAGLGQEPDAALGDGPAGYDGTVLGTAVHQVMQRISFDVDPQTTDGRDEIARLSRIWARRSLASGDLTDDLARQVEQRVAAALVSPTLAQARAGRTWRELYVGIPSVGGVVEGVIDLCIERPDGFVVVDYKTDQVADGQPAERQFVARYRPQLAAYSLMLEELTGQPVVECRLLLLSADVARELPVPDLPEAIAAVRELISSPSVGSEQPA